MRFKIQNTIHEFKIQKARKSANAKKEIGIPLINNM